ncbi:zinc-binding alcohol dehydrogenase family protein [Actinoplanes sp. N902-109]|uniref:quinone oxidoreductase family protein n=1 Tax=Actinoplanes sp. (strain N902-109) TaxID=649831 RepID=UPI000329641B|nr:zinc-binding alcohol dehydrogenase family protein [Actinoplanes sp. N902-109]AGL18230.1 hypothetical protein L083_4720 [Actinoplanes sp. N902-109]
MKAWILETIGGGLHAAEVPEPVLTGGGALIDVLAVHVPAYTRILTTGTRGDIPVPAVLGPAGIGRVTAVADDVFNVRPGDVVVDSGLLRSGDVSDPQEFLVGWTGIGGRGEATGQIGAMRARWRNGVLAQRALCAKETLVRLPGAESYDRLDHLAFLPWLGIAAEGLTTQQAGETVLVMGATGQLGTAAVLIALAQGAARVVAAGRNAATLARLAAIDPRVRPVPVTGDRGAVTAALRAAGEPDLVVDALGATPSADLTLAGFDSLRPGGTLTLIGGVRHDLVLPYGQIMRRRLTVRGSWMCRGETVLKVWQLIRAGLVHLGHLDPVPADLADPAGTLDLAERTASPGYVVVLP